MPLIGGRGRGDEMERFAYFCICFVAVVALAMIIMVIIAVLKVSSEQDDAHDLAERIKFQAREGLISRDEQSEEVRMEGRGTHSGRVEQNCRDSEEDVVLSDRKVPVGDIEGADRTSTK